MMCPSSVRTAARTSKTVAPSGLSMSQSPDPGSTTPLIFEPSTVPLLAKIIRRSPFGVAPTFTAPSRSRSTTNSNKNSVLRFDIGSSFFGRVTTYLKRAPSTAISFSGSSARLSSFASPTKKEKMVEAIYYVRVSRIGLSITWLISTERLCILS